MPSSGKRWAGRVVTNARQRWERKLRSGPLPCALGCGRLVHPDPPGTPAGQSGWVVEHIIPRSSPYAPRMDDASNQGVSHRACSDASGGRLAHARKNNDRKAREGFRNWGRRAYERGDTRSDGDSRPATLF